MGLVVYGLCVITSAICAALLLRGYARTRVPLLLWSGLCFIGLAVNNLLLFIDVHVVPLIDLSGWRTLPALAGVLLLLYGMIWETR
ncbi:MAG TPA: DUF5985 family protein [Thermoanaerobaculia bacterium]|nr:DUF5985 family protein [Thermoanaerobaculia bacterium]